MGDVLTWPQQVPFSSVLIVLAATLALSLLGTPLLMLADRRRPHETTSLVNRWKLFSWLHPFWAAVCRWTLILTVAVLIAWSSTSALSRSHWPAALHDAVTGLLHRLAKPT